MRRVVPLSQMASFFLVLLACDARAEGRCLPGQYPVGGQGLGVCSDTRRQQPSWPSGTERSDRDGALDQDLGRDSRGSKHR